MLMILMTIIPYIGEMSIDFFYVRTVFEWEVTKYSTYTAVTSAASLVGKSIFRKKTLEHSSKLI